MIARTLLTLVLSLTLVGSSNGQRLSLVFEPASNERDGWMRDVLQREGEFRTLIGHVNEEIAFNESVQIVFRAGDKNQAFYDEDSRTIVVSYGFCWYIVDVFTRNGVLKEDWDEEDFDNLILPVIDETILHEMAHALIHVNQLRPSDDEETAADKLVVFIVDDFYGSTENALPTSLHYRLLAEEAGGSERSDYLAKHPPSMERHDNFVCWIYGSDPEKFSGLLEDIGVDRDPDECVEAYGNLHDEWSQLLAPYRS